MNASRLNRDGRRAVRTRHRQHGNMRRCLAALSAHFLICHGLVDRPEGKGFGTDIGKREVEARWVASSAAGYDEPTAYLFDIYRCTAVADSNIDRCKSGYWLRQASFDGTYLDAGVACSQPTCAGLCCTTFHLERGWRVRFRIFALDAANATSEPAELYPGLDTTAPDQILTLANSTVAGDGRHRTLTWQ